MFLYGNEPSVLFCSVLH